MPPSAPAKVWRFPPVADKAVDVATGEACNVKRGSVFISQRENDTYCCTRRGICGGRGRSCRGGCQSLRGRVAARARTSIVHCSSRDNVALIVDSGYGGELGLDPEDSVECVGLSTRLGGFGIKGHFCGSTSVPSRLICTAIIHERVAHELCDDITVLGRAMRVGHYI